MNSTGKLSNMQLQLINMFSYNLSNEQLKDVKKLLSNYFAEKATSEMDNFFEENKLSSDTIEEWSKEHMRKKE